VGVTRNVNQILLSDRRVADAGAAERDLRQTFFATLETSLGSGDAVGSLSNRIATLDTALLSAAGRPESQARLTAVLDAARGLTTAVSATATQVQTARGEADRRIGAEVGQVNTALQQIADLNGEIRALSGTGRDPSALMDQRQKLVDNIASIVPLREVSRDHGQIALFTTGGAVLLEGRPAELGFTPTGLITADMTVTSGALSGLTLNGQLIPTVGTGGLFAGGSLSAHFAIRDDLGVSAQSKLDAVARDLVERFQDPGTDPTLIPGDAGLFTDLGAAFVSANETGLAQRLRLNAAVDLAQGGAVWRLRDGVGAISPGASGNSTLLSALQTALTDRRAPVSGDFLPGNRSFAGLATDLLSDVATSRLTAQSDSSFANARADALRVSELEQGVDTDREMQMLLQIEQAYAANARVIQTVDTLIQTLLEM
jgi:flagellar hook-associated protein 1